MTYRDCKYYKLVFTYVANYAVITDTIPPKTRFISDELFPALLWIRKRRNFIFKIIKNIALPFFNELFELLFSCSRKLNVPDQDSFSLHLKFS